MAVVAFPAERVRAWPRNAAALILFLLPLAAACESVPHTAEERLAYSRRKLQQGIKDMDRGRLDDAVEKFRLAVKYDQELMDAHRLLGKILFHKGEHHDRNADRIEIKARSLEGRGDAMGAQRTRKEAAAERRLALPYYSEALRNLEIHQERQPGNPEVSYMIGYIFLSRDELELAMQSFAAGYRSEEATPKWKRKFEKALRLCQDRLAEE